MKSEERWERFQKRPEGALQWAECQTSKGREKAQEQKMHIQILLMQRVNNSIFHQNVDKLI